MRVVCVCLNPTVDVSSETDVIQPIRKVRTHSERIEPGGGGVNVARVLCEFNMTPSLVYLSGGSTGKLLDEELQRYDMKRHRLAIDSPNRVAYTIHQTSNHQEYRFVPEGPEIDVNICENVLDYISGLNLSVDDVVVASGSLPRGVPEDYYASFANAVESSQARFILDTSGSALQKTLECDSPVFLVKPSLNELQKLAGYKLDEHTARDYAGKLVSSGYAEHVAVSMGSHGAFLASPNNLLRLPAHLVKVQSAVGAGDSFLGGLVYYLSRGYPLNTAFRFGVAAGAAAVMTPGSQLCRRVDVESLFVPDLEADTF